MTHNVDIVLWDFSMPNGGTGLTFLTISSIRRELKLFVELTKFALLRSKLPQPPLDFVYDQ